MYYIERLPPGGDDGSRCRVQVMLRDQLMSDDRGQVSKGLKRIAEARELSQDHELKG